MPSPAQYAPGPELTRAILRLAPVGVALVQAQRILWLNDTLAAILRVAPDELIDKTAANLPHGLADFLDEEIEELTLVLNDGEQRQIRRRALRLPQQDDLHAHFFEDITDQRANEAELERLRALVATLDTRDPETGLKNRNATLQALESQISRSRRYGNPLAVILLRLTPPPDTAAAQRTLREIAQEFNSQLRWADEIGRLNQDTFLLVLPETPLRDAEALCSKLEHDRIALAGRAEGWAICFAVTDWRTGDDARKLLARICPPET